jgi:hypothetical protein
MVKIKISIDKAKHRNDDSVIEVDIPIEIGDVMLSDVVPIAKSLAKSIESLVATWRAIHYIHEDGTYGKGGV